MSTFARWSNALCLCLCLGCSARQPLPQFALRAVSALRDPLSVAGTERSWDLALIAELSFQPGMRSARTLRADFSPSAELDEGLRAQEPCAVAALCSWEQAAGTEALAALSDGVSR